jgi:hypothetical protein
MVSGADLPDPRADAATDVKADVQGAKQWKKPGMV